MTMHGLNKWYNTRPGWVIQKTLPQSKARRGRHGGRASRWREENNKIATLYWSEAEGRAPLRWLKTVPVFQHPEANGRSRDINRGEPKKSLLRSCLGISEIHSTAHLKFPFSLQKLSMLFLSCSVP